MGKIKATTTPLLTGERIVIPDLDQEVCFAVFEKAKNIHRDREVNLYTLIFGKNQEEIVAGLVISCDGVAGTSDGGSLNSRFNCVLDSINTGSACVAFTVSNGRLQQSTWNSTWSSRTQSASWLIADTQDVLDFRDMESDGMEFWLNEIPKIISNGKIVKNNSRKLPPNKHYSKPLPLP